MTMTDSEKKALNALLADNPDYDPSQARDLAQTILLEQICERLDRRTAVGAGPDRACLLAACPTFLQFALSHLDRLEDDIRKELSRLVVEAEQNRDSAQRMYYVYLSPPSEPELVNTSTDAEYYSPPQRTEYRVTVRNLPAFCREQGLKEKEMVRVGMGEIEEHKGWTRRGGYGGPMELGQPYQKPRPEAPARSADGPKEKRTVFRYAPKPIDWFPGLDK